MEFWHGEIMSYDQMTLLDLKKLCKDRGLKVSGKKDEVVIRLMEYDEARGVHRPMATQSFSTPITTMTGQMPVSPQVVYGRMTSSGIVVSNNNSITVSKNSGVVSGVGTIIIIYGIFRMFWALVFAALADGGLGWALAPIAFLSLIHI